MDWKYLFMSFEGRIGRQQWWLGLVALIVAQWILMLAIGLLFGSEMPMQPSADGAMPEMPMMALVISLLVAIPFIWAGLALSAKRWHDRGKSAWWILINLVPVIGGLWALIENGFLKGTGGPNQYGPDPVPA